MKQIFCLLMLTFSFLTFGEGNNLSKYYPSKGKSSEFYPQDLSMRALMARKGPPCMATFYSGNSAPKEDANPFANAIKVCKKMDGADKTLSCFELASLCFSNSKIDPRVPNCDSLAGGDKSKCLEEILTDAQKSPAPHDGKGSDKPGAHN